MSSRPPSRRQEKIKRIVRDAVADIILNRLNDPRLSGFVTITEIDVSPDVRNADIYVSVMAETEGDRRKTLEAVKHATKHIQMLLGEQMSLRHALQLRILEDTKTKKALETLKIIEQASEEIRQKDMLDQNDKEMQGE